MDNYIAGIDLMHCKKNIRVKMVDIGLFFGKNNKMENIFGKFSSSGIHSFGLEGCRGN